MTAFLHAAKWMAQRSCAGLTLSAPIADNRRRFGSRFFRSFPLTTTKTPIVSHGPPRRCRDPQAYLFIQKGKA